MYSSTLFGQWLGRTTRTGFTDSFDILRRRAESTLRCSMSSVCGVKGLGRSLSFAPDVEMSKLCLAGRRWRYSFRIIGLLSLEYSGHRRYYRYVVENGISRSRFSLSRRILSSSRCRNNRPAASANSLSSVASPPAGALLPATTWVAVSARSNANRIDGSSQRANRESRGRGPHRGLIAGECTSRNRDETLTSSPRLESHDGEIVRFFRFVRYRELSPESAREPAENARYRARYFPREIGC